MDLEVKEEAGLMTLRRIAQACAVVALGCLAVYVWLGGTRVVFLFQSGLPITALLHEVAILLLSSIGGTLAIVAPTLLLVAFGQARQWIRFRALLSLAILLTLVGSLTFLYYLLPAFGLPGGPTSGLDAPTVTLATLVVAALNVGPSALLALSTLAFSAPRTRRQRVSLFASSPDSNLELHIEPILRHTSE
jgi:hypothetical protein